MDNSKKRPHIESDSDEDMRPPLLKKKYIIGKRKCAHRDGLMLCLQTATSSLYCEAHKHLHLSSDSKPLTLDNVQPSSSSSEPLRLNSIPYEFDGEGRRQVELGVELVKIEVMEAQLARRKRQVQQEIAKYKTES
jgi:hypothetical protein